MNAEVPLQKVSYLALTYEGQERKFLFSTDFSSNIDYQKLAGIVHAV